MGRMERPALRALGVLRGAQGSQGPQGPQGPKGEGTEGAAGASVAGKALSEGNKECPAGGSEFKAGSSTTYACNGSPWTAGGTLPKGSTEQGVWTATPIENGFSSVSASSAISFGIPLTAAPTVEYIKVGEEGKEHATECPGTLTAPKAAEGFLCVYTESPGLDASFEEATPYAVGARLEFTGTTSSVGVAIHGTWAVTEG